MQTTFERYSKLLKKVSMHKSKCPICHSTHSVKNGKRRGIQLYKCKDCGCQFRNNKLPDNIKLWQMYQENKQTVKELSWTLGVSESTIKRYLRNVSIEWFQPSLSGEGYVHLDATYWGHNWGVMAGIDAATGSALYVAFIHNETNADYIAAVKSIKDRGYDIKGLIIDGKQSLFSVFSDFRIQMCQFHMKQIVRRYLTLNPKLKAARALKEIMDTLTTSGKESFEERYFRWKEEWHETLFRRSQLKSGKTQYTHRRLRSAMHSVDFYLPYLFTFQTPECNGMPNTNNKIEGTFTDLKKNLNNHSGMSEENRKRFICGFFLALNETLSMKKQDPSK